MLIDNLGAFLIMKPSLNHVQTFGHVVEQQEQRQQWNSGEQFLLTLSINFAERPALSRYSNIKHQNILTPVTMKVKIQLSNSCIYYLEYISVKVDPHVRFPHKYCCRQQLKPSQQPITFAEVSPSPQSQYTLPPSPPVYYRPV